MLRSGTRRQHIYNVKEQPDMNRALSVHIFLNQVGDFDIHMRIE
jgi:hypothetical protein